MAKSPERNTLNTAEKVVVYGTLGAVLLGAVGALIGAGIAAVRGIKDRF